MTFQPWIGTLLAGCLLWNAAGVPAAAGAPASPLAAFTAEALAPSVPSFSSSGVSSHLHQQAGTVARRVLDESFVRETFKTRGHASHPYIAGLIARLRLRENAGLLVLGCGTNPTMLDVSAALFGLEYVGIDYDADSIEEAKLQTTDDLRRHPHFPGSATFLHRSAVDHRGTPFDAVYLENVLDAPERDYLPHIDKGAKHANNLTGSPDPSVDVRPGLRPVNSSRRGALNSDAYLYVAMFVVVAVLLDLVNGGLHGVVITAMYWIPRVIFHHWPSWELGVLAVLIAAAARAVYEWSQTERFPRVFVPIKDIRFRAGASDVLEHVLTIVLFRGILGPFLFYELMMSLILNNYVPGVLVTGALIMVAYNSLLRLFLRLLLRKKSTATEAGIKAIGFEWRWSRATLIEIGLTYWRKEPHALRWVGLLLPMGIWIVPTSDWTSLFQKMRQGIQQWRGLLAMNPGLRPTQRTLVLGWAC